MREPTEEEQYHFDRATAGKEAELFWDSRLGKYLQDRAARCYSAAIERLKNTPAHDIEAIRTAQNDAHLAEQFVVWVTQSIQEGLESLKILEGNEDDLPPSDE